MRSRLHSDRSPTIRLPWTVTVAVMPGASFTKLNENSLQVVQPLHGLVAVARSHRPRRRAPVQWARRGDAIPFPPAPSSLAARAQPQNKIDGGLAELGAADRSLALASHYWW